MAHMAMVTGTARRLLPQKMTDLGLIAIRRTVVVLVAMLLAGGIVASHQPGLFLPAEKAAFLSSEAAAAYGRLALSLGRDSKAEQVARNALLINPLPVANLGILATAREQMGDRPFAGRIMSQAAAYGWRDNRVQIWLFSAAAQLNDWREAIRYADALARRGRGQNMYVSVLLLAALDSKSAPLVAERLAVDPPYRQEFFALAGRVPERSINDFVSFLALARRRGVQLSPEDLSPFVKRLIAVGEFRAAARVWQAYGSRRDAGALTDGSFERFSGSDESQALPFDWTRIATSPVELFVGDPGESGVTRAMNLRWNSSGTFDAFFQDVVLPPGTYLARALVRADQGDVGALRWRMVCLPDMKELDAISSEGPATGRWHRQLTRFMIPAECKGQRLIATVDSDEPAEYDLWVTHVGLARQK